MYYKQSAFVIGALLGTNNAYKLNFATGMNGDEDLGQDIIMKGEKFHYTQDPAAKNDTANIQLEWDQPSQGPAEGVLYPQTGLATHHTTFYAKKSPDATFLETEGDEGAKGTPVEGVHVLAVEPHQNSYNGPSWLAYPQGERTTFYAQKEGEKETAGSPGTPVEGVHVLAPEPHINTYNGPSWIAYPNQRTTFYGQQYYDQQDSLWRQIMA